jgi:predicted dithiol-disulfide oxidoreductase (DUF899 family)
MRHPRLGGESPEYLARREELRLAGIELMRQRERVAEDVDQCGIDLLCRVWHVLDLTPQRRADWYAELSY